MESCFFNNSYYLQELNKHIKQVELNLTDKDQKKIFKEIFNLNEEIHSIQISFDRQIEEMKLIHHKVISNLLTIRKNLISNIKGFWVTSLSNSKSLSELIADIDLDALNFLKNIKEENSLNSKSLIFEFNDNPYFENKELTKTYLFNSNGAIEEIQSNDILWKKNYTLSKSKKSIINTKTGEKKFIEIQLEKNSFFNFFYTKKINEDNDKLELIAQLDSEIKLLQDFKFFLLYAVEFYISFKHQDFNDFINKSYLGI